MDLATKSKAPLNTRGEGLENIESKNVLEEYCKLLGGSRPIRSVLISNNGISAVKFIRSIRSWAYESFGNERIVLIVAMATPEDMKANAEHIKMADQFIEVPGGTNNNNYANVQLIVEIAERTEVDAVWPGWGHASENPDLPAALLARDIVFLGPPAEPMAALGDKIGSSIIAQAAGVPTLPWSGSKVKIALDRCAEVIPPEIYKNACVDSVEEALASCNTIGYPAMIKASWGGGGKGIRKVQNEDDVKNAFKQIHGEVPGSPIFIMKLASKSRHLEVQLVCDVHGNVAALHSRDCSVQRRHQKIIEEGPITVAPLSTIKLLEKGACRLAKSVGYVGAATVEYLYSMENGEFYFLELNPRLQVEHPVTEWIAGVNLPATQLCIGMGIPLWKLPEIRRLFGQTLSGGINAWRQCSAATSFDFTAANQIDPKGHVVAVRITSEDPDDGFKPTSGRIQELSFKSKPDVWAYFSVKSSGSIHEYSDSQFGHLFAFGQKRLDAIANMVLALKDVHIRGEIRTNVDYAIDLLHSQEYQENRIHTGWLDARIAMRVKAERPPWHLSVLGGALFLGKQLLSDAFCEFINCLEKGSNPPKNTSLLSSKVDLNLDGIKYTVLVEKKSPTSYQLQLNNSEVYAEAYTLHDGGLLVQLDGNSHVVYADFEAAGTRLFINGRTCLLQNDHNPSKLVAETPCKLLRHLLPDGSHVVADAPFAEVEVMKMCMPLLTSAAGKIHYQITEGRPLQAGDVIATLELDDTSAIKTAQPFTGLLPLLRAPFAVPTTVNQRFTRALNSAKMVLAGYKHNVAEIIFELEDCLDDRQLPYLQWKECFSVHSLRLPKPLRDKLINAWEELNVKSYTGTFPAKTFKAIIQNHLNESKEQDKTALESLFMPMIDLLQSHDGDAFYFTVHMIKNLIEEYLRIEEPFNSYSEIDVIESLRIEHKQNLSYVLDTILSHQGLELKNELILSLLHAFISSNPSLFSYHLNKLASLKKSVYSSVASEARKVLERSELHTLRQSIERSLSEADLPSIKSSPSSSDLSEGIPSVHSLEEHMELLVDMPSAVEDALTFLFDHGNHTLQSRAVEAYIRRLYHPYLEPGSICIQWQEESLIATWKFWEEALPSDLSVSKGKSELFLSGLSRGVLRWGAMVVVSEFHFISSAIAFALVETCGESAVSKIKDAERKNVDLCQTDLVYSSKPIVGVPSGYGNVLHVVSLLRLNESNISEEKIAFEGLGELALALLEGEEGQALHDIAGIGIVSCMLQPVTEGNSNPLRRCFQWSPTANHFTESNFTYHLEPPLAELLETVKFSELKDLSYERSRDRHWHVYSSLDSVHNIRRIFFRSLIRPSKFSSDFKVKVESNSETSPLFPFESIGNNHSMDDMTNDWFNSSHALSALEIALQTSINGALMELEENSHNPKKKADDAHLFMSVLRPMPLIDPEQSNKEEIDGRDGVSENRKENECAAKRFFSMMEGLAERLDGLYSERMRKLKVTCWEVRFRLRESDFDLNGAWRMVVNNPSGFAYSFEIYKEFVCMMENGEPTLIYCSPEGSPRGKLHGSPLSSPYPQFGKVERKRLMAKRNNTTYCYDFIKIMEASLRMIWKQVRQHAPNLQPWPNQAPILECKELILKENQCQVKKKVKWEVVEIPLLEFGLNEIGMVAFKLTLRTPECPRGRPLVIISNDISHKSGSFGPLEDKYFKSVLKHACRYGIPLLYIAANSGARIGIAEEVWSVIKVEWVEANSPEKGFEYIYLTEQDYANLKNSVIAYKTCSNGETRYVLTDVIGREDGIGVECLSGSGSIAGIFSKAYSELPFTATFVTGRTVGIGAYLARLGMRCIQRSDQPIILTGYSALNKLLGKEVYSSHLQLGGPRIMAANGVVHQTVSNDFDGITEILKWLSYIPPLKNEPLPYLPFNFDPIDREVEYSSSICDPRMAICGETNAQGKWLGGIFDRGSFTEALQGWAQTAVIGRARLGGIPIGVIAVESKPVHQTIPADPGRPDLHEQVHIQAGQVWYPDSAAKTAQAICDFNHENLPLFILANWRGFSGGQKDLFEGILQSGSLIVEQLRVYSHPVFIYIPQGGELRGGAWVVLDTQINSEYIEMYADESARAGILEPEGILEIKFRPRELFQAMNRLDSEISDWDYQISQLDLEKNGGFEYSGEIEAKRIALEKKMRSREKALMPLYKSISRKFVEMHDTPVRMKAKGCIRDIIPWKSSRKFFAARLRRRLAEQNLVNKIVRKFQLSFLSLAISPKEAMELLVEQFRKWCKSSKLKPHDLNLDDMVNSMWNNDAVVVPWMEDCLQNVQFFEACFEKNENIIETFTSHLRNALQLLEESKHEGLRARIMDIFHPAK